MTIEINSGRNIRPNLGEIFLSGQIRKSKNLKPHMYKVHSQLSENFIKP